MMSLGFFVTDHTGSLGFAGTRTGGPRVPGVLFQAGAEGWKEEGG
jgi:hypothetical protein